ncbi:MAG: 4'-phosphopantetheinyl transferase family protein [Acidimicrobiales bacterium]
MATRSGSGDASALLERLLPPTVAGVITRIDDAMPSPDPTEAALVTSAVARRRHEFLVGRACAHSVLAALGRDDGPIGVGSRRQPLWPDGVVGSIAHGGDWAGAVVAREPDAAGLGLDIERLEPPLAPDVEALVLSRAEKARLPADPRASKVIFMAKECVYKALFPATGWALEFSDVQVDLDLDGGRWRADLVGRPGPELSGRFEVADGHAFTAVLYATSNTGC